MKVRLEKIVPCELSCRGHGITDKSLTECLSLSGAFTERRLKGAPTVEVRGGMVPGLDSSGRV